MFKRAWKKDKVFTSMVTLFLCVPVLILVLVLTSCTDQQMAKKYGGTANIQLQQGEKLVMITWKADNLWILTRPMTDADKAETYTFRESSSFGLIQGKIFITEKK